MSILNILRTIVLAISFTKLTEANVNSFSAINGVSILNPITDLNNCGSIGTLLNVEVTNCTNTPCNLISGYEHDVKIDFIAGKTSSSLNLSIIATKDDGSKTIISSINFDQNFEQNNEYTVQAKIENFESYLDVPVKLNFELFDLNDMKMEICLEGDFNVLVAQVTESVYFDVKIGDEDLGRIVIGMFGNVVPLTVKNFVTICNEGINGMSYNGSIFHRVINKFMIQGGDIVNGDGSGSISIYGPEFDDENFIIKHRSPGYISMANSGPNTNGCQFFITAVVTPWLDGFHVVFGKVIEGQEFVHLIETTETDSNDRPISPVSITRCGII